MTTQLDALLTDLETKAAAATPGPWNNLDVKGKPDKKIRCNSSKDINKYPPKDDLRGCRGEVANALSYTMISKKDPAYQEAIANASYISACDPTTIRALVAIVRRQQEALRGIKPEASREGNRLSVSARRGDASVATTFFFITSVSDNALADVEALAAGVRK